MYADIIADDVITLENIGDFLLNGPRGDRTRQMLAERARPGDRPGRRGRPAPAVQVALGRGRYDVDPRARIAREGVEYTHDARSRTRSSAAEQADKIRALVATRTKELPPRDFVEMMRAAIREDEWMLYAHGAIMGFGGGVLHLWIFGVGGVMDDERRRRRRGRRDAGRRCRRRARRPRRCPAWPGSPPPPG